MKKNKHQFSSLISNEEHLKKSKEVLEKEVLPYLKDNQKAYKKYLQDKKFSLAPNQKIVING